MKLPQRPIEIGLNALDNFVHNSAPNLVLNMEHYTSAFKPANFPT